jgi:Fe-Mn family superoxide dismutase
MAKLKPLPYAQDALEPTIGAETVRIHHGTHQAGYVKGWNKGLQRGPRTREDYEQLAFNGAGVILHELYWENLCSAGESPPPSQQLLSCMARCFGSAQAVVDQMSHVGAVIQGSGWVVLAWVPRFERMVLLPVRNHQNGWIPGAVPLLVIDVWEHAYYLDYQAARAEYLRLLWHNVNWGVVSARHAAAGGR